MKYALFPLVITFDKHNFALYVPDLLTVGDMDNLLMNVVPKLLLVTHGTANHIFPPESVHDLVSEAYADVGVPKRFETLFSTAVTSSPRGLLERLDWLDRQFDQYYWVFRWEN